MVGVAEKLATFSYDLVHQFDKIRRYTSQNDDAGGNQGFATSQYVFDKNGRLDTLAHTKVAGNSTIAAYDWNYDRVSRVSAMDFLVSAQNHEDVLSYAYNPRNELTNVTRPTQTPTNNETYAFDKNGNRTSSTTSTGTASYQLISGDNNENRIFRDGQFQYSYDAEGNMTQRTQLNGGLANGPTRNFTWDHRNRLVKVELRPSPGGTVTQSVEYRYDAFNQLIGRIHDPDGPGSAPPQETWFIHDEGQIVLEGTGTADTSVTHRYLWGPAVDQILADEKITTTGSTVDWALGDNLGTVRDWISSSGTVIEHLAYDAFGNVTFDSAATIDHLFAYTGRLFDKATGLQNNLHRWYDPHQGRWMNQDPIGFAAYDTNLYRYVQNETTGWTDHTGLKPAEGHHWVPLNVINWALDNNLLSPEEAQYCSGRMSGALDPPHAGSHPTYDKAVKDELCRFKDANPKTDLGKLKDFVDDIATGKRGGKIVADTNADVKKRQRIKDFDNKSIDDTMKRGRASFNHRAKRRGWGKFLGVFAGVAAIAGHMSDANAAANILNNSDSMKKAMDAAGKGHLGSARHYLTSLGTNSVAQEMLEAGLPPTAVYGFIGGVNTFFDELEREIK